MHKCVFFVLEKKTYCISHLTFECGFAGEIVDTHTGKDNIARLQDVPEVHAIHTFNVYLFYLSMHITFLPIVMPLFSILLSYYISHALLADYLPSLLSFSSAPPTL